MGEQPTLSATLQSICEHAVTDLQVDAAGIFLTRGRRAKVVAMAGQGVAELEKSQLETDEGPCLDAIWQHESVLVEDLRLDGRWPTWAARMVEQGWLSGLALQLLEDGRTVGSLNLFSQDTGAFQQDDLEVACLFARHASLALASSRTETSLSEAVDARHRIGLAQGILMERHGLSAEHAFSLLRRYSQDGNIKIQQVATTLIETGDLPALPAPSPSRRRS